MGGRVNIKKNRVGFIITAGYTVGWLVSAHYFQNNAYYLLLTL